MIISNAANRTTIQANIKSLYKNSLIVLTITRVKPTGGNNLLEYKGLIKFLPKGNKITCTFSGKQHNPYNLVFYQFETEIHSYSQMKTTSLNSKDIRFMFM